MIPKYVFFSKGVGSHLKELESFEYALRDAGISQFNLVQVLSILPPNCKEISREKGLSMLSPGEIVFVVMSRICANEKNRLLSAAVGVAKPKHDNEYGYLSEYHTFGKTEKEAGEFSEDMAASMLASTLGIPFNLDAAYDEKRQIFMMSDKIVETKNICSSAIVKEHDTYTTVLAAAVFVFDSIN